MKASIYLFLILASFGVIAALIKLLATAIVLIVLAFCFLKLSQIR
jgi:hypothetical protein